MQKGRYVLIGLLIAIVLSGLFLWTKLQKENPSSISEIGNVLENVSEKSNSSNPSAIENLRDRECPEGEWTFSGSYSKPRLFQHLLF